MAKAAKNKSETPQATGESPPAETTSARVTWFEQWFASLRRLKNKKAVVVLLFIGAVLGRADNLYQGARRLVEQFEEPLKIEEKIQVIHEPWMYVVSSVIPGINEGSQPKPMWLFFYVTVHNRADRNIWISDYLISAHTRDRNRWIQLTPPPQNAVFTWLVDGGMGTLKRQQNFNYNAAAGPIQRDGYLTGWMFFETCIAANVDKLEFEFHDKEEKLYRLQVSAVNGVFGGKPGQSPTPGRTSIAYVGGTHTLDFDNNDTNQTPEMQAYMRGMYPYISIYQWMRGQQAFRPCSDWKPSGK